VAYIFNMSCTVAIEDCLTFNVDVVFDLMYFRFRHSKVYLIADVPRGGIHERNIESSFWAKTQVF
jgi:hypothetical protein